MTELLYIRIGQTRNLNAFIYIDILNFKLRYVTKYFSE